MDHCADMPCAFRDCMMEFDPNNVCQCNDDCESYGNCCQDVGMCRDCSKITDPCECDGMCGWSSERDECVLGSRTNCHECSEGCEDVSCAKRDCLMDFNPDTTCQCDEDCARHGNCCEDVYECRACDRITDPCRCEDD